MTPRLSSARAQHYSIQILTGAYVYNNNNNIISACSPRKNRTNINMPPSLTPVACRCDNIRADDPQ